MALFLADLILIVHALFVAFVVFGLAAVMLERLLRWGWPRNWWFRLGHLLAIGIVIGESWFGLICPLTEWENRARITAGGSAYSTSFIQHWLHELLFYDFEPWVFTVAYTAFGILVLIAWLLVPPERPGKS